MSKLVTMQTAQMNVIHNNKRMLRLNLVFKLRGGVTTIAAVVLTVYLDSCLPASCANIISKLN